jgi:hypothetical protein
MNSLQLKGQYKMGSMSPSNGTTLNPTVANTELSLSDTASKLLKPEMSVPHKHQIHVLIIGMKNCLIPVADF